MRSQIDGFLREYDIDKGTFNDLIRGTRHCYPADDGSDYYQFLNSRYRYVNRNARYWTRETGRDCSIKIYEFTSTDAGFWQCSRNEHRYVLGHTSRKALLTMKPVDKEPIQSIAVEKSSTNNNIAIVTTAKFMELNENVQDETTIVIHPNNATVSEGGDLLQDKLSQSSAKCSWLHN